MKIKYNRLFAYLIDIFLVSIFISLITGSGVISSSMDKYNDANKRLEEKYMNVLESEDEISKEDISDIESIIYDINSFGSIYYSIEIICMIGYFVIFQYFNKGQTIGKKIMKIKIVNKDNEPISLSNLLLRNILLYGLIFNIINMIAVLLLSPSNFYYVYTITSSLKTIITLIIYFMILFRQDERGLHDLISSSKVIEATN